MTDSELIDALGGPAELGKRLDLQPVKGRNQRVFNWKKRGIPARIRLEHRDVFAAPPLSGSAARPATPQEQQHAA